MLKRTLFEIGVEFPAYQASKEIVSQLGGIPATPIMLKAGNDGRFRRHFRGFTDADSLQPLLCS
ncbi:hypothetical protein [Ferrimonas lipolytica]|uniref:Glutaredoxin n=1 Tax=Ferrimonas lipolytica TaxID=2724191 RepID=A0A6H1UJC2_9GAMM|nr:hypothetical protein [Ferrimonas lipolytica]QIZ78710.1 hypothetical protein HER31_18480 [Ferrimonas lipolytica]